MTIEEKANEKVSANIDTTIEYLSLEAAKQKGAMALFEDKYGDTVRTVTMGDSIELCGGTHVKNTADIGRIAIISIENKGADTYRIEGTTTKNINEMLHQAVEPYQKEILKILEKIKKILTEAKENNIQLKFEYNFDDKELKSFKDVIQYKEKLAELKEQNKQIEKEYKNQKHNMSVSDITAFTSNMEVINGIKVLAVLLENYDIDMIKSVADAVINK